ncbi:hypothetical protein SJAG_02480 [Schizosaccharomyces japonicus yFS275]|uniref:Uncharacterized protein n=1 Tax=Schizosaccharomyces japonicus (strain yFS275 / FY16936) TaxID=402676 RepID=B6K2L3_SCHJY|nr:hypothetical protein SJAG_02480 [Schizosaccharomyces japonicus yFS275]EEB07394.1 hypothetical protein SJAG_02480 [Schizosaccharomyces japonicus yFS275]
MNRLRIYDTLHRTAVSALILATIGGTFLTGRAFMQHRMRRLEALERMEQIGKLSGSQSSENNLGQEQQNALDQVVENELSQVSPNKSSAAAESAAPQ